MSIRIGHHIGFSEMRLKLAQILTWLHRKKDYAIVDEVERAIATVNAKVSSAE